MAELTRPLVIAHRGHSSGAPEQTLAAFRQAIDLGADMIEADVRVTRDGHLVLCHDARVDRTTSGRGFVGDHTYADLRLLDAGSWFDERYARERIPLLDELYDLALEGQVALCLEVKGRTDPERTTTALAVAAEIGARGRFDRDVLASFDHGALRKATQTFPRLQIAPDRVPERGRSEASSVVSQAASIRAPIIQHHHEDLVGETVAELHANGIEIWAWPPLTPASIDRLLEWRVDGIMGDDVAAIRSVVGL